MLITLIDAFKMLGAQGYDDMVLTATLGVLLLLVSLCGVFICLLICIWPSSDETATPLLTYTEPPLTQCKCHAQQRYLRQLVTYP